MRLAADSAEVVRASNCCSARPCSARCNKRCAVHPKAVAVKPRQAQKTMRLVHTRREDAKEEEEARQEEEDGILVLIQL